MDYNYSNNLPPYFKGGWSDKMTASLTRKLKEKKKLSQKRLKVSAYVVGYECMMYVEPTSHRYCKSTLHEI